MPELCVSETCSIQWGQLKACWPPLVTQQQLRMQAVLAAVLQKQISPGACLQRCPHSPPERAHSAYDSPMAQLNGLIQDYPELSCLPISSFSNFDQQINPGSTSFFFPRFGPTDFNSKFRHTIHYCGKKYLRILNPINFIIIFWKLPFIWGKRKLKSHTRCSNSALR